MSIVPRSCLPPVLSLGTSTSILVFCSFSFPSSLSPPPGGAAPPGGTPAPVGGTPGATPPVVPPAVAPGGPTPGGPPDVGAKTATATLYLPGGTPLPASTISNAP